MFALPFVFVIFIINFQAGLIVYWITTNVWTIGQQLLVKKLYPKPEPRRPRGRRRRRRQARAREAAEPAAAADGAAGGRAAAREGASAATGGQRRPGEGAAALAAQEEEAVGPTAMSDDPRPEDLSAEGEGDSLGEAKWAAMKELEPRFPGITAECVSFEVVEEPESGGAARVRAEVDEDAWREAAEVIPEEPGERVRAIVGRVVHALGLRATVDIEETEDELRATVNGDELGLLIGKHGVDDRRRAAPGVPRGLPRARGSQAGDRGRGRLPRAPRDRAAPDGRPRGRRGAALRPPGGAGADAGARSARSCTRT